MSNQTKTTIIEKFISIQSIEDRYHSCPGLYEGMGIQYEESNEVDIKIRLRYSPEQNQEEFSRKQEKFKTKIEEIKEEYIKWIDDIDFYDNRTPNAEELEREKNAIKDIIKYIDERMDPERFFENGPDDTELCGKFIIKMDKDEYLYEDIIDMICLLSALQWLMRKEAEICSRLSSSDEKNDSSDTTSSITEVEEDEETAILRIFLENLKPHFKRGVTYRLLFIAKDICHSELVKPYAITIQKFSEKIAPILDKKPKSLNAQICKAGGLLKIEGTCNYHRIATLTEKQINTVPFEQEKELELWKKQYKLVKSLMPSEMLAKASAKELVIVSNR